GLERTATRDAARQRDRRADHAPAEEGGHGRTRTADPHCAGRRVCLAGRRAMTAWWSAASIRVRLTAWYAVVLSLMLVVYATPTEPRYESIVANRRPWRTLTGTSLVGGRAVVLRVSRAETRLRTQLWEVLVVLVFGLPVVVVLAGVGGYVLARRALTPIDHLASEARRITAERLHERLSVPNQHDEIGRLAAV